MNLSGPKRQKGGKQAKQAQRTLAFILAALTVSVSLAACSGDGSENSAETTLAAPEETTAPASDGKRYEHRFCLVLCLP